jgi:fumarate hydratase class II
LGKQTNNYRIERDSMGEVQVPSSAWYGAQTQRALENFTISRTPLPWRFIVTVLHIKAAAATVNEELQLLRSDRAARIRQAVARLIAEKPLDQFPVSIFQTGSGTSTNMNINEVVANLASTDSDTISPNDHVNLGQSSNDVIPAAIHISSGLALKNELLPALAGLARLIRDVGEKYREVIKTGRTHLMDAVPLRLQAELEAWATQLDEAGERLASTLTRLERLSLGGTAIGSGLNCHPQFGRRIAALLGKETGLNFQPAPSLYKQIASLDSVVELSGQLKSCSVALHKIANDLRWMNSGPLTGLGEINLPALQPGSSIMPAKVNPVIPEAVIMACAQVIGNDTAITLAGLGGSFQLNTMLPLAAANLLQSIELLANSCLGLGEKVFLKVQVNTTVYERALALNPILVTSLNPVIGYLKAAEIGKIASKEKRPVLDVALEHTELSREELTRLLDPARLANPHNEQ